MMSNFWRIIKSGWLNFWRNRWLSSSAVLMMSLVIFSLTSLLLVNVLINSLAEALEDKIDISVYFNLDAPEEQILKIKEELAALPEVRVVEYISREKALENFKQKHQNNDILMQSLQELDDNPLEASLNIKAQETSQYETIAQFLNQEKYQKLIDKINYLENKAVIARLASITGTIRRVGFITLMTLAALAVLVAFNTLRLTIYNSRQEIKVMKLVGASDWFIRGPFLTEGALYGIAAVVVVLIVMYPLLWYLSPKISLYLPGTDIFTFFKANLLSIALIQFFIGIALGAISSFIAIRRYLEV